MPILISCVHLEWESRMRGMVFRFNLTQGLKRAPFHIWTTERPGPKQQSSLRLWVYAEFKERVFRYQCPSIQACGEELIRSRILFRCEPGWRGGRALGKTFISSHLKCRSRYRPLGKESSQTPSLILSHAR